MSPLRLNALATAVTVLLLQACASATDNAAESVPVEPVPQPEPELTLNLPGTDDCVCSEEPERDFTFLEKGLNALAQGDHIEAVTYFQRYQRLESSPEADWEAGIAIAYDSMLSQSPFYDRRAAMASYQDLRKQEVDEAKVHREILLMRDALTTFSVLQFQVTELQADKVELKENLAKREDALKRLRELTLGQKGATP